MEYKDGPITYYEEYENDGIESDVNTKNMLLKQYESNKKKFVENSKKVEVLSEEFDENIKERLLTEYAKAKTPQDRARILMTAVNLQKNNIITFDENEMQQMKEGIESGIVKDVENEDSNNDSNGVENDKEETLEEKVEELEEMTDEIEEISEALEADAQSKKSYVSKSAESKCITKARAEYEQVLDAYRIEMARYIVKKNELVAKREQLLLNYVNRAINTGEDLSPYLDELVNIENEINGLDLQAESKHVELKAGVENAQSKFKNTKENVRTNMVKNGIAINRQKEYINGVLQSDTMSFPRADNKVLAMRMSYDDILATAPEKNVNYNMSIRVGDSVINVSVADGENGVINSFSSDGIEYANTQIGEQNKTLRDINGSLLKDYPELEQVLDRLDVNSVTEIPEVCDEIEDKQEEIENTQENEQENDNFGEIDYENTDGYYDDGEDA